MTGNALRRARAFLGYTQSQMAAACGMSLATLQRREALAEEHVRVTEESHVLRLLTEREPLDADREWHQLEVSKEEETCSPSRNDPLLSWNI